MLSQIRFIKNKKNDAKNFLMDYSSSYYLIIHTTVLIFNALILTYYLQNALIISVVL